MGRYLSCGIAHTIYIKNLRDDNKNEEALSRIGQNIDLNLYERIDEESDKYIILKIKKDVFEKNVVEFIEEQSKFFVGDSKRIINETLQNIKGKTYDELIEIAKERNLYSFSYIKGNILCNNAFYLDSGLDSWIFCDVIDLYSTGKILIEDSVQYFSYLRKCIIEASNNPIKTALVVTVIG